MKNRVIATVGSIICLLGVITFFKLATESASKSEYLQKRDSIYLKYAKAKQSVRDALQNVQSDGEKLYDYFNSDDLGQLIATIEDAANDSTLIDESYSARTDDSDMYQDTANELRKYQETVLCMAATKSDIPNRIALLLLFLTDESDNIAEISKRLENPKNYRNINDLSVEWK